MEKEDGEMSDDGSMVVDDYDIKPCAEAQTDQKLTVLYKADKNGLSIQALERVDAIKIEERAKRFGLNLTGNRIITQKQIDDLYSNFGIENGNERHFRFDTLHLNGVSGLSTKDIFEYLEDYKPISLEWIDDTSCNIVCQDHISAALALLVHSREIRNENLKDMIKQSSAYHWREGMPHEKQDLILMRFATKSDKKDVSKKHTDLKTARFSTDHSLGTVSKNPWGDLCQTWGVYDHQEIYNKKLPDDQDQDIVDLRLKMDSNKPIQVRNKLLAKRLGKRAKSVESETEDSDSEWTKKSKAPRMRMHADDEETRQLTQRSSQATVKVEKEIYTPLTIEVENSDLPYTPKEITKLSDKFRSNYKNVEETQRDSIRSRLGKKLIQQEEDYSSDNSSDKTDHNVMSRVQKVSSRKKKKDVWSRLQTQNEEKSSKNDLRHVLSGKSKGNNSDLRQRLGKPKGLSLRIEINNDYHESD